FDGIVITTDWGLRFIDADRVELITICNIRSSLDDAEADRLPPPDGAAVYRVSSLDEIGDSLHERLGRVFRRPHWTHDENGHTRANSRAAGFRGRPPRPAFCYPCSMSTDSHDAPRARKASLVPDKPSLDGIEDRWSRRWEDSGVVQV